MAEPKPVLVLHLVSGGDPLLFPLASEETVVISDKIPELLKRGSVHSVQTRDGYPLTVNFGHIAAAYVDDLSRKGKFGLAV